MNTLPFHLHTFRAPPIWKRIEGTLFNTALECLFVYCFTKGSVGCLILSMIAFAIAILPVVVGIGPYLLAALRDKMENAKREKMGMFDL